MCWDPATTGDKCNGAEWAVRPYSQQLSCPGWTLPAVSRQSLHRLQLHRHTQTHHLLYHQSCHTAPLFSTTASVTQYQCFQSKDLDHKMLLKEPDNVSPCILLSIVSKSWKTFNPSQIIKDLKPLELVENQIRELFLVFIVELSFLLHVIICPNYWR